MNTFIRAVEFFFHQFTEIGWHWVGIALVVHLTKTAARTRAWQNILKATYPDARVRWCSVFGATVAGVGVNAVVPARGGDLIKLYLVRRRVDGAAYPTLASTLVVETAFDFVVATGLFVWAVSLGVLPSLSVLPNFNAFDWAWMWRHPIETSAIAGALLLVGGVLLVRGARRVNTFKRKVAQGFTVWRSPGVYVRSVVPWQTLDWFLRITEIYLFLLAFGIIATVDKALIVQVINGISTVLPFTPAGIGTEQALLVFAFASTLGITTLLAFSIGMKAIVVAFNLVVGFSAIAIMLRTLRWRRHVESDREPHPIRASITPEPEASST